MDITISSFISRLQKCEYFESFHQKKIQNKQDSVIYKMFRALKLWDALRSINLQYHTIINCKQFYEKQ